MSRGAPSPPRLRARPRLWGALALLLLAAPPSPARAETQAESPVTRADVVLFEPRAANLDPPVVEALTRAVEEALHAALPEAAIAGPAQAAERLSTTGTPEATAAALGAEQWITVRAIRIDTVTEIALTRHRPGFRPTVVRGPLPPIDDMPIAARAWVAELLSAPDPTPPPPLPADARRNDKLSWGVRAGGVWSIGDRSRFLADLALELHDRSGRWFMGGALVGRVPVIGEGEGRYGVIGARLRSGLYAGPGPMWPSLWLGIEPRLVVGEEDQRFGLMPVAGVGLDLEAGVTFDVEVGYNLIGRENPPTTLPPDVDAAESRQIEESRPVEVGLSVGLRW